MNKHDIAAARRDLLTRWRGDLIDAINRQARELGELFDAESCDPITPPPLRITMPSCDSVALLLSGIDNALAGKPDPFGIEPPKRGIKPLKTDQQMIAIVADVLTEIQKNKSQKVAAPKMFIQDLARKHGVSNDTIKKALKDKRIRGWATYQLFKKK